MLTLFWRGNKARIQTNIDTFEIGHVVIFFRDNKMFAHRIVDCGPEDDLWITKGDTRMTFDRPVNKRELLGIIDCIEKKGHQYPVHKDLETAHLSATLGNRLNHQLSWLPNWLKFIYYFVVFIPSYYRLVLKRKNKKIEADGKV